MAVLFKRQLPESSTIARAMTRCDLDIPIRNFPNRNIKPYKLSLIKDLGKIPIPTLGHLNLLL